MTEVCAVCGRDVYDHRPGCPMEGTAHGKTGLTERDVEILSGAAALGAASPIKRDTFEFNPRAPNWDDPDGSMEVTSGPQGVTFSVTEEKAVDSYNSEFTCEAVLPRPEAERLRDWLIEVLS